MQQRVDVGLEPELQMILVYLDPVDDELQIVAVEVLLVQQIVKNLHGCFCGTVDPDNGVALVGGQLYLILQVGDASDQLVLQLVIGAVQNEMCIRDRFSITSKDRSRMKSGVFPVMFLAME